MIRRYTHPEMGRIWSDQRKYETWLQVEVAAAEAMARAGIVPAEAARDIRERGAFDIARIEAIEEVTQHDVIAFTTAVAEHVGPSARWLHFGMTSSDVIDTAQAVADEVGLDRLTLVAIADRLEIKPPSLYNHVDGLDGILRELALRGALYTTAVIESRPYSANGLSRWISLVGIAARSTSQFRSQLSTRSDNREISSGVS